MNPPSFVAGRSRPKQGLGWLQHPLFNKGTAFTEAERDRLGLRGLLPPRVFTLEEQVVRVLTNFRKRPNDLERYVYLMGLQDRNETLFYRVLMEHLAEMLPIVYTPTVGRACQEYGSIFRRPRGLYVSAQDRGRVPRLLRHWPHREVRVIVVTDGERILGLGDLGAQGMGIPVGKLSLYTACGGVHPQHCLPVTLDVGTENPTLLENPLYTGLKQRRVRGAAYDELVDEFVGAVQKAFRRALIQFEDFGNVNAFRLLKRYQNRVCAFNDDIQGTGAVTLAGIYSALRITGRPLQEQTMLFLGAGEAGIGIGDLISAALEDQGLSPEAARRRCWFVDSKGLVVRGRRDLAEHKLPYAHEHPGCPDLLSAIAALKPSVLIGVSGVPQSFPQPVLAAMAQLQQRPIILALSNPTSKAECTAQDAYTWTQGRAIYASGSPFPPVNFEGRTLVPGQGNNAYIFPGVGLGVMACAARHVTDSMFFRAAKTLAGQVRESDLDQGRIYPALERMAEVSAAIATAVAEEAYALGLARAARPEDLAGSIRAQMYQPVYPIWA
ncbi:MAG: NAD-dependent malic enzyme [Verrucomicrobia bacterium]|nr:NAD-dependent malic enzyme [Verrucomicrobiota bacterium]